MFEPKYRYFNHFLLRICSTEQQICGYEGFNSSLFAERYYAKTYDIMSSWLKFTHRGLSKTLSGTPFGV